MPPPLELDLTIDDYLRGRRIDKALAKYLRNHTTHRIQRMVTAGLVRVEDTVVGLETRVAAGQRVRVRVVEPPDKLLAATRMQLDIVFEDDWLIVVDKPPGMIIHPVAGTETDTLVNGLQWHLDQRCGRRGLLRPGIIHRLDRDTSGLLVVATHHLALRRLSVQFQERHVEKVYLALVEGHVESAAGDIDQPIGRVADPESILMSAGPDAVAPRPARTSFRVLERLPGHTLVELRPETGRLHQLRVHLATIGYPVAGDRFYAAGGAIKQDKDGRPLLDETPGAGAPVIERQALHAIRLGFEHPLTGERVDFEAPPADDLRAAIARLRESVTDAG